MSRICAAIAVTMLMLSAAARAEETSAPPPEGKALYAAKCQICHSADGSPKPALKVTANFKDPAWQAARTDEALIAAIRDGKTGTTMTAWKDRLTPEQIATLVAHIRTLAPRP